MLNVDQSQRRDIDTTLDDRLTLAIDEENIADNPYIFEPTSFVGNNWFKQGSNIVKLNLVEQDSIVFVSAPLVKLLQKDITNVIVSFDYNISNVNVNYPILSNISLTCMDMTNYMLVENILTTQGHIDVDCSLFNFSSNVVNTSISEQGFKVGINLVGNKSNATIKLSNVQIQFKYNNKLLSQSDSVINRLEPYVDFWREDDDLVLQIGGDASGKGIDHNSSVDWSDIQNKPSDYPPSTHNHDDRYYTESEVDTALNNKQDTLVSGTSIKTINNTSLLGSGNISIGGGGSSVDIATTWGNPTSDSKVPSEKLAKDSLDTKANSNHTHTSNQVTDLIDTIYPVGSIYMSVSNTSPSILFGGTWEQIKDTFLLATGDTYANGSTGGEATHTLTVNEMPSHTHIQDSHNHTQDSHNHTQNSHNHSASTDRKFLALGKNDNWGYTNARQMQSTSGSYYYPYSNKNTSGLTEPENTASKTATNQETTATNQATTATNQNTGGGQAHNNMPPYLAVNIWKRTA